MFRVMRGFSALGAVLMVGVVTAGAQPQMLDAAPAVAPASGELESAPAAQTPAVVTIAKGFHSNWGIEHARFGGADLVIRDPEAWGAFWRAHRDEDATPPMVDFRHRIVLAVIQGVQPTTGGPNIAIVNVQANQHFTRIHVFDDPRPGPVEELSNPFHIVSVAKSVLPPRKSLVFSHVRPERETGVVVGRVLAQLPDGDFAPLSGARVALRAGDEDARVTQTGRDGSYFFVDVEPGAYLLTARHPEFEPAQAEIEVPPNQLVSQRFVLVPRPPAPGAFVGCVFGAEDGTRVPIAGALVRIERDNGDAFETLTGDEGRFQIVDVPPGEYVAIASADGWLPAEAEVRIVPEEPTHHRFVLRRPE